MPTYLYLCPVHGEFEEYHSMAVKLEACPECIKNGSDPLPEIRRLINSSTPGVVELTGHELAAKTKDEIRQIKSDMKNSEKTYANMLGEGKYQSAQQSIDKFKRNR